MLGHVTGLWRHDGFVKLWAATTISLFGTLIGRFALPLVAIFTLDASPIQMGILRSADVAAGLFVALAAGVWIDRLRRRPILIAADLGRAGILALIPLLALAGVLRFEHLVAIALVVGVLTTCFDLANRAYLPTLIAPARLVEANSKLQATSSVAEVAGFGLAGAIVQVLTAPVAVLIDSVSFLLSALALALIRADEPAPAPSTNPSMRREIHEGLRLVVRDPILRAIALARLSHTLSLHIWVTVLLLYLTRELGLSPLAMGLLFAIGGVTSFAGALAAESTFRRVGVGRALIGGLLLESLSTFAVALAGGPHVLVLAMVGAQQLFDAPAVIYEIGEVSLMQTLVPHRSQGRVNADYVPLGHRQSVFTSCHTARRAESTPACASSAGQASCSARRLAVCSATWSACN